MATAVELHAMRRLSSGLTFFYKRIFPTIWFGGLGLFVLVVGLESLRARRPELVAMLIVPLLMAVIGFAIMKLLVWKNVDEVWDAGDAVLVRDDGREELVPLADVRRVDCSCLVNPETITLRLETPSAFGDAITFIAPVRAFRLAVHPLVVELNERVAQARRSGHA